MVSPIRLVRLVADREPIPQDAVDGVDVVALGQLVVRILAWPRVPGAGAWLRGVPAGGGLDVGQSGSGRARVGATTFVRGLLDGDPRVLVWAGDVDVLGLAVLAIVVMDWPALVDPRPWLDLYDIAGLDPAGATGG